MAGGHILASYEGYRQKPPGALLNQRHTGRRTRAAGARLGRRHLRAQRPIPCITASRRLLPFEAVYRHDPSSRATNQVFFKPVSSDFDPAPYDLKQVFYPLEGRHEHPDVPRGQARTHNLMATTQPFSTPTGASTSPITPHAITQCCRSVAGVGRNLCLRQPARRRHYGQMWHEAGMLGHKQNVFDDFAWAAKYLIAQNDTSPGAWASRAIPTAACSLAPASPSHPELFGALKAGGRRAGHAPLPALLRRRALGSRIRRLG